MSGTVSPAGPAAPAITSLSPNKAAAGSPGFTLVVNGTGFVAGSVVRFNGVDRAATGTDTQLTTTITAAEVATAGTYNVAVVSPDGSSTAATAASAFTVFGPNPAGTTIYVWNGSSASWSNPTSWTLARNVTDATDLLVFDGDIAPTTAVTLDFAASQTVASLLIQDNANVTFNTSSDRTLNISNGTAGADLAIAAGSRLTLYNTSNTVTERGIVVQLGPNATARIAGDLVFDALNAGGTSNGGTGNHQLLSAIDASSVRIEFVSGSSFTAAANASSYPFGELTGYRNTVIPH